MEIDEDDGPIDGASAGPPPCKLARKQVISRVHCDGSSTDPEIDGMPIKTPPEKTKRCSVVSKVKAEKRQMCVVSCNKKIRNNLFVQVFRQEKNPVNIECPS